MASDEMGDSATDLTSLLNQADKDPVAENRLFQRLEDRFRNIAEAKMRHERADHSLQPTVLVHDAFLKLVRGGPDKWENREQFFCAAAKVMRQHLIDHARRKQAEKRGGGEAHAALDDIAELLAGKPSDPAALVAINDTVEKLERDYPEAFEVFDLHFFGGFQLKEIAEEILEDTSYKKVKTRWKMAKAFLHRELVGDEERD